MVVLEGVSGFVILCVSNSGGVDIIGSEGLALMAFKLFVLSLALELNVTNIIALNYKKILLGRKEDILQNFVKFGFDEKF